MPKYTGTTQQLTALSTFVKLMRATERLSADVHSSSIFSSGLTVSQFGILEALYHLGPLNQKDLGKKILKTPGNITTVIKNLEKRGMIVRERQKGDRRSYTVSLTSEGRNLISTLFPNHVEVIVERMARLTLDEQQKLGQLCKKLSAAGK